jgi:uncharacterized membrane protein YoaT (DUF817 family)
MHHTKQLFLRLCQEIAVFAGLSTSILWLYRQNWALLAILSVCLAMVLWKWHGRSDLIGLIVIASLGTASEVLFVRFGVWQYANPSCLGVPLWFPIAFGLAGLLGQRLSCTIAALCDQAVDSNAED